MRDGLSDHPQSSCPVWMSILGPAYEQVNAQPYSKYDWHWRLLVAHRFGHAASAPATHAALKLLDDAGIDGELAVREVRTGRVEITQMWGRPESVRQDFRRIRAQ